MYVQNLSSICTSCVCLVWLYCVSVRLVLCRADDVVLESLGSLKISSLNFNVDTEGSNPAIQSGVSSHKTGSRMFRLSQKSNVSSAHSSVPVDDDVGSGYAASGSNVEAEVEEPEPDAAPEAPAEDVGAGGSGGVGAGGSGGVGAGGSGGVLDEEEDNTNQNMSDEVQAVESNFSDEGYSFLQDHSN